MRTLLAGLSLIPMALAAPLAAQSARGEDWWKHVDFLASDALQGRLTGSPGYDTAADYVIAQFKALGLRPAGVDGYKQPIGFTEQSILSDRSSAALISAEGETALKVPGDIIFGGSGGPVPETIDAPLAFAGYGLHLPEVGYDDFAGLDVKGKIVVVISGGPSHVSGALKSHARS